VRLERLMLQEGVQCFMVLTHSCACPNSRARLFIGHRSGKGNGWAISSCVETRYINTLASPASSPLLAGRVPDFELYGGVIECHGLCQKRRPNGRLLRETEITDARTRLIRGLVPKQGRQCRRTELMCICSALWSEEDVITDTALDWFPISRQPIICVR